MTTQLSFPGMPRTKPPTGQDLKRRGIEQVIENERIEWRLQVSRIIEETANDYRRFTVDHVQNRAAVAGVGQPHHQNAWGAAIRTALQAGVMRKTGEHVKGQRAAQHGRMIPEYERVEVE